MTSDPGKPYHHGDLRRALLDAALESIDEQGMEGLSLRGIARRAGVSHAAPYHHFSDRAALVAAVAEEGFRFLRQAMLDRIADVEEPRRRLQQVGVGYVLFAVRHPAHFRVMFSPEVTDKRTHPSLEAAAGAAFGVLSDAIHECQAAGALRERDIEVLSATAWSLVHGLAVLSLAGRLHVPCADPMDVEALTTTVTDVLWEGLARGS